MEDNIAFIITDKDEMYIDGEREYRIYFDGHITGFREGRIINYALPVFLRMKALEQELENKRKYIKWLVKRTEELENSL